MTATQPTITRQPVYSGYGGPEEDFWLLVDGENIATTWHYNVAYVDNGARWASDGPAGISDGHATREDAEQVQIDAHRAAVDGTTERIAESAGTQLSMTWEQALDEAKKSGVGRCSEPAAMAAFCKNNVPYIVGAVAPQLIWEGAMKKRLSFKELGRLANRDPLACSQLQWL